MASYNIPNKPCKLTILILTPAAGVGVGLVKASTLKQWSLKPKKKTTTKINEIGFFNTQIKVVKENLLNLNIVFNVIKTKQYRNVSFF